MGISLLTEGTEWSTTNSLLSRKVISYLNVEVRDKKLETVKYPA